MLTPNCVIYVLNGEGNPGIPSALYFYPATKQWQEYDCWSPLGPHEMDETDAPGLVRHWCRLIEFEYGMPCVNCGNVQRYMRSSIPLQYVPEDNRFCTMCIGGE